MKLAILGGGGFRTPLVYAALAAGDSDVTEVALHDTDPDRLAVMAHVLAALPVRALERPEFGGLRSTRRERAGEGGAPRVRVTADLDSALEGADFVFSAIRVGGLGARVQDER